MLMDHCGEFIQNNTCTPKSLYNSVRFNTILDITLISVGPQLVMKYFFLYIYFLLWLLKV